MFWPDTEYALPCVIQVTHELSGHFGYSGGKVSSVLQLFPELSVRNQGERGYWNRFGIKHS